MTDLERMHALSEHFGIAPDYYDIWGTRHEVSPESVRILLHAMGVPPDLDLESLAKPALPPAAVVRAAAPELALAGVADDIRHVWKIRLEGGQELGGEGEGAAIALPGLPWGYHRIEVRWGDEQVESLLVAAPDSCYVPPALNQGRRVWGPAVQLYGVRREGDFGMGDFTSLQRVAEAWAEKGAAVIGVNPLHSLFPHEPRHCSPYSPSSRLFLNTLYIDVTDVADFHESGEAKALYAGTGFQEELKRLRATDLVDYMGVFRAKMTLLEKLYANFRGAHLAGNSERAWRFWAYQHAHGPSVGSQALFDTLNEFHGSGWRAWPEEYRDPASPAVARFAEQNRQRVEFFTYIQWLAEEQLAAAGRRSLELGLGVGLYFDLALGVDAGGADAWANQDLYAFEASTGCPPDDFNLKGQDWGLPPMIPHRLQEAAYQPWIDVLRSNMRHAGALRIDHVMSLMRLFWLPAGGEATDGAYVRYPFRDLLGILALESQRNQCLVVGEDLGTVPEEVRSALEPMGVLSYRLLYFEKDGGSFKAPAQYPAQALVSATTHDLPTFIGWWRGIDLTARTEMDLFPSPEVEAAQYRQREADRPALVAALRAEGLLDEGWDEADEESLVAAIYGYLARSPASLLMVQMEDVLREDQQVNFPGTVTQYPNWRRRLSLAVEHWRDLPMAGRVAAAIGTER